MSPRPLVPLLLLLLLSMQPSSSSSLTKQTPAGPRHRNSKHWFTTSFLQPLLIRHGHPSTWWPRSVVLMKACTSGRVSEVPGEIKRSRDLRGERWSWTFKVGQKRSWVGRWSWTFKVAQKRSWVGRWSWTFKVAQKRSWGGRWSWTFKVAQKRSWVGRWSWTFKVAQKRSWVGRWSWTFKVAQKRSWVGRWSWSEQVGPLSLRVVQVVHQQQCSGHCDSVQAQQLKQ